MRAVVLLSGGVDSSVALAVAKKEDNYHTIHALTFDYGHKTAKKEIECAQKIAHWCDVKEHKIIELPFVREISHSALTDSSVKLVKADGILEYVPMRNTIFLSIASAWAEAVDADAVITGSNLSDTTCPDNSPQYLDAFQKVVQLGSVKQKIDIYSPLIERKFTKNLIIKKGTELGVPFAHTWSCHNNTEKACGICGNCAKRLEAFRENILEDPILYEVSEV
ncbi:MAG: 7-cyano-7-deazaguanine synthase QueC [Theionarchaea archaeon]|nr:MAG: hypothetical protein AYK19_03025 [Theionarchaea archaeon DG-70-1]MBU7029616.1 7-cyano-7-deazaguanine synthase QueC [Theionarchaea archaeon]